MKYIILFALVLFTNAQAAIIEGSVFDIKTKSSLIAATVSLTEKISMNDRWGQVYNPVEQTISDLDGNFEFRNLRAGDYLVQICYVGYFCSDVNLTLVNNNIKATAQILMVSNANTVKLKYEFIEQ